MYVPTRSTYIKVAHCVKCPTQLNLIHVSLQPFVLEDLHIMSDGSILSPQYGRSRTFRSHSLKPSALPSVIAQRTKRTHSLPACKHVQTPLIQVDRLRDLYDEDSETEYSAYCENVGEWLLMKRGMGKTQTRVNDFQTHLNAS